MCRVFVILKSFFLHCLVPRRLLVNLTGHRFLKERNEGAQNPVSLSGRYVVGTWSSVCGTWSKSGRFVSFYP